METIEAGSAQAEAIQATTAVRRAIERRLFHSQMADWISLNLTMGQLKAMMALAREAAPGMNVSALAEALHIGKPAASILVDQLVQMGYAQRTEDADDRRRTLVALTPLALDLVERLRQGGAEPFVRWLGAMDPDDLAALTHGLQALLAVIEREDPASPGDDTPTVAVSCDEAPVASHHKRATVGAANHSDAIASGVR